MHLPAALIVENHSTLLEIRFTGDWVIREIGAIEKDFEKLEDIASKATIVDVTHVAAIDTAGAWLIYRTIRQIEMGGQKVHLKGANDQINGLIEKIAQNDNPCAVAPPRRSALVSTLETMGKWFIHIMIELGRFLSFVGLVSLRLFGALRDPKRIKLAPVVNQIEQTGFFAVFVVFFLSFVIGGVIVSQGAVQLRQFGAEILVVDMLAITHLREMGIFLTSIILAGRSGSAFTAQIGSMRSHEEIEALETIGLNAIDTLVIPRVLALVIALPLLTVVADFAGIFGGMLVAVFQLDITVNLFFAQLQSAVTVMDILVGLSKAPVFAAVIALSGCYEGMSVTGSAESVGARTTSSVVQSIVLIILLDGAFAMYFTFMGV